MHPASDVTEVNRTLVRDVFDTWRQERAIVLGLFAPDLVWRIVGGHALAGTYGSRAQLADEVLRPFAARFRRGVRFRPVATHALHAAGDIVSITWDGAGVTNDRRLFRDTYTWVMRLRAGLVVDGTMFCDGLALEELWRQVTPA